MYWKVADKLGKSVTPVYERIKQHLTAFTTVEMKECSTNALRGFERGVIKFPEVME